MRLYGLTYCSVSSEEEKSGRGEEGVGDTTITVHWYDSNRNLCIVRIEED